jgi:hypothetical protein
MANRRFHRANLFKDVVQLEFDTDGSHPLSIIVPVEDANMLAASLINALRKASNRSARFQELQIDEHLTLSINDLPVNRAHVADSVDEPDRVFLHLDAGDGLSLSYSFERKLAQEVGKLLAEV